MTFTKTINVKENGVKKRKKITVNAANQTHANYLFEILKMQGNKSLKTSS